MKRYWMAVASYEHVKRGVAGGFAQVCHGKGEPLKRMTEGDGLIYYSPTQRFREKEPCRAFTAIGLVTAKAPYQVEMAPDFTPWRREVNFFEAAAVPIEPLITQLSFIRDPKRWGFPFRRGCFSITAQDYQLIASKML